MLTFNVTVTPTHTHTPPKESDARAATDMHAEIWTTFKWLFGLSIWTDVYVSIENTTNESELSISMTSYIFDNDFIEFYASRNPLLYKFGISIGL